MRDLYNQLTIRRAISPGVAVTDNTAFVSQIIDRQGFDSLVFAINTGSLADANATFLIVVASNLFAWYNHFRFRTFFRRCRRNTNTRTLRQK